ncbi:rhodanese-like domain-containing protein [Clostridium aestuarii]|uniref:Rhodanese-like domain-containing protein n=1 Tax=Clostridium aestuarii TaxID=338193 RepID=A0ABT4CW21_9CLOT|nr:rhodanese-like domain-containing protein [Clostridium aestuarii]MCY6483197.1 rhodanese-like domain-containing protein [Clostridium aestuarii]
MYTKKLHLKTFLSSIILILLIFNFILPSTAKAYKDISPSDVRDMIDTSTLMLVIDVRVPKEYSKGKIRTSVNIPLNILKNTVIERNIPKSTIIITYSQDNATAYQAAKILDSLGYQQVYTLGSINSWPYEIIR